MKTEGRKYLPETERYRPKREGWNLCTNFADVLTDSGVNDFNIGILNAALFLIVCYTVASFLSVHILNALWVMGPQVLSFNGLAGEGGESNWS